MRLIEMRIHRHFLVILWLLIMAVASQADGLFNCAKLVTGAPLKLNTTTFYMDNILNKLLVGMDTLLTHDIATTKDAIRTACRPLLKVLPNGIFYATRHFFLLIMSTGTSRPDTDDSDESS